MAQITIKNIPEKLYKELKRRAKRYRRSLNSEIIYSLEKTTFSSEFDPEAILEEIKAFRSKIKSNLTEEEIRDAKNWGRP